MAGGGRRVWLQRAAGTVAAAALGMAWARPAAAQLPFPSRAITLWVPWQAGGATDISFRVLASLASPYLGQPVTIDNRSGAGGTMAMPILRNAEPDGYTIAQLPYPAFRLAHTQKVTWDPIRDVTPILQISGVTFGLLVPAASPFRSLGDLFSYADAHPGALTIATNGMGTTPHMVLDKLFSERGLRYIHVPYKGTSEQINAITGGQVMAGVNSTGFAPAVDAGHLRLLVTFAAQRSARWPGVPTLRELGFPIVAQSPYGLVGPRGLPPPIVQTLHDAFKKAMFQSAFRQELAKYDQELDYLGPADYARACQQFDAEERANALRLGLHRDTTGG